MSRPDVTPSFLRSKQRGMAAVEQRKLYQRELLGTDSVLVAVLTGTLQRKSCAPHERVAQAARASLVDYPLPW